MLTGGDVAERHEHKVALWDAFMRDDKRAFGRGG